MVHGDGEKFLVQADGTVLPVVTKVKPRRWRLHLGRFEALSNFRGVGLPYQRLCDGRWSWVCVGVRYPALLKAMPNGTWVIGWLIAMCRQYAKLAGLVVKKGQNAWFLCGERIRQIEALQIGFVEEVVESGKVRNGFRNLAQSGESNPRCDCVE